MLSSVWRTFSETAIALAFVRRYLWVNVFFPPAEDMRCGDLLAARGDVLRPAMIGLLAFAGRAQVLVFRRPRVALLCTGSELVEATATPRHGQIRNSNAFALASLIAAECGSELICNITAPDQYDALYDRLRSAREGVDLLVTTGGASSR